MKLIFLFLVMLLFNGCDLFESNTNQAKIIAQKKIALKQKINELKEVQLKKLSAQTQKELAILKSKKELALIEKEKELAKIRMQSELEKQKIIFEQEKQKTIFEQKIKQNEQANIMELKRYVILIFGLFVLVSSFFVFYYFKKRREDKLRAYQDNLQKYFNQKENDARVKIAEKMLDAISSGTLDKSQENQLIGAFSGQTNDSYQKQLTSSKDEDIIELSEIEIK